MGRVEWPTWETGTRRHRHAFTLVELLVVIAVIGVLAALLLPAIQAAREGARRGQCISNMRQVSLALQSHYSSQSAYPPGCLSTSSRIAWMPFTLPHLEDQTVFERLDLSTDAVPLYSSRYSPFNEAVIPVFLCPSDGTIKIQQGFNGNIVGNAGSSSFPGTESQANAPENWGIDLDGIFFYQSQVTYEKITDGSSHTLLLSEIILQPDTTTPPQHDTRGRYYNPKYAASCFMTQFTPNTTVGDRPYRWCIPGPDIPCEVSNPIVMSARSRHPGGVNTGRCDGSVAFVSDSIDADLWRALGSRNGAEVR